MWLIFFYHRLFQECITSGKKAAAYFGSRSNPTEAVKILRCRCWKVDRHILVWLSLSPSLTHSYSDKMKISSIQTKFLQLAFSLMGRMPHEDFKMLMKNSKKSLKWFFTHSQSFKFSHRCSTLWRSFLWASVWHISLCWPWIYFSNETHTISFDIVSFDNCKIVFSDGQEVLEKVKLHNTPP